MKKYFILISVFLFVSGGIMAQDNKAIFSLNDTAYIKIVLKNVPDSFKIELNFCQSVPYRACYPKVIRPNNSGTYYLNYATSRPGKLHIHADNNYEAFLIPNDTIEVLFENKLNENNKSNIHFEVTGPIQDYYIRKSEKIGYNNFYDANALVTKYFKTPLFFNEFGNAITLVDSLKKQSLNFLSENSKELPAWFIDTEYADIIYNAVMIKNHLKSRLKEDDKEFVIDFAGEINNPKARYSNYYYDFIADYFFLKDVRAQNENFTTFLINDMKYQSGKIDTLLGSDIKYLYLTYKLSDIYLSCETLEDTKKADDYILANYTKLTDEQLKFINSGKNRYVKLNLEQNRHAPDFYLKNNHDKFYKLSDFKGKNLCIHFWATWCAPCIKEMQEINKLFSKSEGKPFEIINICLDNDVEKWKQIIEKEKLAGVNLICKGNWETKIRESYFIGEIPHFTIIDQNGQIRKNKISGPKEAYSELKKMQK